MKNKTILKALLLCLILAVCCLSGCRSEDAAETTVAEITAPETTVPETTVPATTTPATEPVETEIPETTAPIIEMPATEATEPTGESFEVYASVLTSGQAVVFLPEEFSVSTDGAYEDQGWQLVARSEEAVILGAREDRAMYESHGVEFPETLEDYVNFLKGNNAFPNEFIRQGERYYTSYEGGMNGETKFFYLMLAQGEDAYWMVHFICDPELAERYEPDFSFWGQLMMLK